MDVRPVLLILALGGAGAAAYFALRPRLASASALGPAAEPVPASAHEGGGIGTASASAPTLSEADVEAGLTVLADARKLVAAPAPTVAAKAQNFATAAAAMNHVAQAVAPGSKGAAAAKKIENVAEMQAQLMSNLFGGKKK